MIDLVGSLVNQVFPNFNNINAVESTWSDGDDTYVGYYDRENPRLFFAKYYVWKNELQLNHELFSTLENFFGDDMMTYVIDWFNNEFDKDAENVTF